MKQSLWAHRGWHCLKELGQVILLDWCDLVGGGMPLGGGFEFLEAKPGPVAYSLFLWPANLDVKATSSVQGLPAC